ncbi:MAG TPA: zinc ribbon domain-containing protein [Ramlibacter sp.]|nr:zinc ribbon domain-containing protein [Ramlibacter sp.]
MAPEAEQAKSSMTVVGVGQFLLIHAKSKLELSRTGPRWGKIRPDRGVFMPIYEYACHQCGNEFEALVRSGTVPECPSCHSRELKKMLSVFATAASGPESAPALADPCASCGHGPGGCGMN